MLIQDLRCRAVALEARAEFASKELEYRLPRHVRDETGPDKSQLDHLERTARVAHDVADAAWRLVVDAEASKTLRRPVLTEGEEIHEDAK